MESENNFMTSKLDEASGMKWVGEKSKTMINSRMLLGFFVFCLNSELKWERPFQQF